VINGFIPLLRPGGIVIVDNSDQTEYAEAPQTPRRAAFSQIDFHGLGPTNAYAWTASVVTHSRYFTPRGGQITTRSVPF
jgi:predicted O-methyltransferase YrrM